MEEEGGLNVRMGEGGMEEGREVRGRKEERRGE